MEKRLHTIDGATLMSRPLQPLNFVVDTLISQGLHILAGSPKVGKSWLALWLAVTVAKGGPVWGIIATGMRRGECCGLKWSDIDYQNHSIHIQRNTVRIR